MINIGMNNYTVSVFHSLHALPDNSYYCGISTKRLIGVVVADISTCVKVLKYQALGL